MSWRRKMAVKAHKDMLLRKEYYPVHVEQKVWSGIYVDKRVFIPILRNGQRVLNEKGKPAGFMMGIHSQTLVLNGVPLFKRYLRVPKKLKRGAVDLWSKHRASFNLAQKPEREWHWKDLRLETNNTYHRTRTLCPPVLKSNPSQISRVDYTDYKTVLEEVARICGDFLQAEAIVNKLVVGAL